MQELFFASIVLLSTISVLFACHLKIAKRFRANPLLFVIYSLLTTGIAQAIALMFSDQTLVIDTIEVAPHLKNTLTTSCLVSFNYLVFGVFIYYGIKLLAPTPVKKNPFTAINRNRYALATSIIFIVVIVSLFYFASFAGTSIMDLLLNPGKRLVAAESGPSEFQSNGPLRILTRLGMPLLLFTIGYIIYSTSKITLSVLILMVFLLCLALAPAISLSNRGAVAYAGTTVLLMLYSRRKVKLSHFVILGTFAFLVFSVMSSQRHSVDFLDDPLIGIKSFFYYGGGNSLFNNTMIYEYVKSDGSLQYGKSYIGALCFPIPRSIWPSKPLISLDEFNAYSVYGIPIGSGFQAIPAGMLGEAFLNFGILGAPFIVAVFGTFVAKLHCVIYGHHRQFLGFLLNTIVLPRFVAILIASGLGFAVMEACVVGVPILLIYFVCIRDRDHGPKPKPVS